MRSRLISLSLSVNGTLKPRFGRRRCSGIWPPSKPLMRTPERAVWPLPPRPPVLPAPEPIPRPMRKRFLREPGRGAISLSFIAFSLFPVHDADEMLDLGDHAAGHWRVRQAADTADLVEFETDQRFALGVLAPHRAADLFDLDGFARGHVSVSRLISRGFAVGALAASLKRRNLDA